MAAEPTSLPLDGRVAIVTGGSRGIGRAIALHLRSLGAKLVINYASNSNQANILASELNSATNYSNPIAVTIQADVSDPDQVKLLFDKSEQEFGTQAHILINCAGILVAKYPTIANTTVEDWDATFNVNTKGAFLCCHEAANRLARGGGGRIILISTSVVGASLPGFAQELRVNSYQNWLQGSMHELFRSLDFLPNSRILRFRILLVPVM